jgi:arabinan endo-1,5-alpha-L-arabinosidase
MDILKTLFLFLGSSSTQLGAPAKPSDVGASPSPSSRGSIGDTYTVTPADISSIAAAAAAATSTAAPASVTSHPAPGTCKGDCSLVHDPAVIVRDDGKYFRFSTFGHIQIATAKSIKGPWKNVGSVLQKDSEINKPGKDVLWAPDVFLVNGTYYLYYSVSTPSSQNSSIGVATSKNLEPGSWKDHGSIGLPENTLWNRIDPNLFQKNPDAPFLMSWGSYWNGIYQLEMEDPPLKIMGDGRSPAQLIYNGTERPDDLPRDPVEGGYQFWQRVNETDYYYLFFASGSKDPVGTPKGEDSKIMVCRSKSANGNFVGPKGRSCVDGGGVELLGTSGKQFASPGGQGVMFDKQLKSVVIYYHYGKSCSIPSVAHL